MPPSTWQLEGQLEGERAALAAQSLAGFVELARPALGLHDIHVGGQRLPGSHLLGVSWGDDEETDAPRTTSDGYVRAGDLIATYAEEPLCPYAPQVYWRALGSAEPDALPHLELWTSVQTRLLDARPKMRAHTRLPAAEVLRLLDAQRGQFAPVAVAKEATVLPADAEGCLLLRLPGGNLSYVEMVHPLDFVHARLAVSNIAGSALLTHMLIDRPMEKGVIVRARVRGCFLPRAGDTAAAARLYAEFAESALPLSA